MNKLILRGALLLALAGLILLVLLKGRSPFGKDNSSFATDPKDEITRIEFSDGQKRLTLSKEDNQWLLNGKDETRKSGIVFILRVLTEIKIKSPVSDQLFNDDIIAENISPVKVKVYRKRKLLKSFLVYKTSSNLYGNIMKMRERSKPFIVYVPGYDLDIGSAFSLNELYWQPYTVFNLLPSEINSVELENNTDTTASFSISVKNHHYQLSDDSGDLSGWDSTLVTRYLSYFIRIPLESWVLNMSDAEKKSIESGKPLYRITVCSLSGDTTRLTLWEKMTGTGPDASKDSDRLYGKTQTIDELFIMRYFDIDPLLKKKSYFFPE